MVIHKLVALMFTATMLACLLLPHAQAAAVHPSVPSGAFIMFQFPGYTSLHDCSFFQSSQSAEYLDQAISPKACIESLRREQHQVEIDPEYASTVFFRKFIGAFGSQPLLYVDVGMLLCNQGDCRKLQPHRTAPPEMLWHPPEVENKKTHLIYPLPTGTPRHQLRLAMTFADGQWRSNLFDSFWFHEYLNVSLNETTKTLTIKRDWSSILTDSVNFIAIWNNMGAVVLIWLCLLVLAVPGLLAARLRYQLPWPSMIRIWLAHAAIVALTMLLFFLLLPSGTSDSIFIRLAMLAYLASSWPEYPILGLNGSRSTRAIVTIQMLMRIPFILLLLALGFYI